MSRFYADIQGTRGPATRQGHKEIHGHVRGWNIGVKVYGSVNKDGEDEFAVYLTSGSHGDYGSKFLGSFTAKDLEEKAA